MPQTDLPNGTEETDFVTKPHTALFKENILTSSERTTSSITTERPISYSAHPTTSTRGSTKSGEKRKDRKKPGILSKAKSWLSMKEPSASAFEEFKKNELKKANVTSKDNHVEATAKLHIPSTKLPPNTITPASGPKPEKIHRQKVEERRLNTPRRPGTARGSADSSTRASSFKIHHLSPSFSTTSLRSRATSIMSDKRPTTSDSGVTLGQGASTGRRQEGKFVAPEGW